MSITLPREQQEWLKTQVAAGVYEAVASIFAEPMQLDFDDLSWARSLVDEGRVSIAREGGMALDDHKARITERLGKLVR